MTAKLARSHAVTQGLKNKRKLQQDLGDHFRPVTVAPKKEIAQTRRCDGVNVRQNPRIARVLSAGVLDPFETLAVNSNRLRVLLCNRKMNRENMLLLVAALLRLSADTARQAP